MTQQSDFLGYSSGVLIRNSHKMLWFEGPSHEWASGADNYVFFFKRCSTHLVFNEYIWYVGWGVKCKSQCYDACLYIAVQ